tara:strand:+ start:509 stop:787 length:279 start_codon:yes stop_codon:yes gene_type:complete
MKRTVWAKAGTYKVDGVEVTRRSSGWTTLSGSFDQIKQSYLDITGNPLSRQTTEQKTGHQRGGNFYTGTLTGDNSPTEVDNDSVKSEWWDDE